MTAGLPRFSFKFHVAEKMSRNDIRFLMLGPSTKIGCLVNLQMLALLTLYINKASHGIQRNFQASTRMNWEVRNASAVPSAAIRTVTAQLGVEKCLGALNQDEIGTPACKPCPPNTETVGRGVVEGCCCHSPQTGKTHH